MSVFGNRLVATLVSAALVLGSTAMTVTQKLNEQSYAIEQSFFVSENGKSMNDRINARLDAANGLWSIVQKYDEDAAAAISTARAMMIEAQGWRDIASMYDANEELSTAFASALAVLSDVELSENDADAVADYRLAFEGAQKLINESDYNSRVDEFVNGTLHTFPASVFYWHLDVFPPYYYR